MNTAPESAPQERKLSLFSPRVLAWAAWDWGSAAFNAVMSTFVFTIYLTSNAFGTEERTSEVLGYGLAIAGVLIALTAPVTGLRADANGRRKLWLGVNSILVAVLMALCFFVFPSPEFLLLGVGLIALGNIFFEFAGVNYNAMLHQVSTPSTVGKVSGFGWAMGYVGGIVALFVVLYGFIQPEVGLFGITSEDGLNVRAVTVFSALWFAVFALPVFLVVPELKATNTVGRIGLVESYRILFARIARLFREQPNTIRFLLASAIFRDGLAAVFTFGGVIAAGTFGFELAQVIQFAIVSNMIAAIGAIIGGFLDDRVGPKAVIIGSLIGLLVSGAALLILGNGTYQFGSFTLTGTMTFWIFGLLLSVFVGPAQASSRAFLSRLAPGREQGELFGLYATTGRAVSFLAPLLFGLFITIFDEQRYGIIGILLILLAGLLLLLPVRSPEKPA